MLPDGRGEAFALPPLQVSPCEVRRKYMQSFCLHPANFPVSRTAPTQKVVLGATKPHQKYQHDDATPRPY